MKKLYSTFMMLAIIIAALSFTACGGDDDDNGNGGGGGVSTQNYLEVTIDGQKYTQIFNLPFTSMTLPSEIEKGLLLSSSLEEKFNGNLDFSIAIYHKSTYNELQKSSSSTYNVIGNSQNIWQYADEIHNLTLQIHYTNGYKNCEVTDGTHKVTSVKRVDDGTLINGTFTASLNDTKSSYEVSGKYQVTIPVK